MKKTLLNTSRIAVLCTAFLAASTQAAIVFDFTSSGSAPFGTSQYLNTINTQSGGLGLNIFPFITHSSNGTANPTLLPVTPTDLISGNPIGIYTGTSGLGMRSYDNSLDGTDNKSIDGSYSGGGNGGLYDGAGGVRELLLFQFSSSVSLDKISFSGFNSSGICTSGCDDFNLNVDGVNAFMDRQPSGSGSLTYTLPSTYIGTSFLIWADGTNDDFRIAGLEVTAVPVPAAVWLFGTGILGLLGFSRRRKATSALAS